MRNEIKNRLSIALAIIGLIFIAVSWINTAPIHAATTQADLMWVDPAATVFNPATTNVGDKFNVTIWLETVTKVYTWQTKLSFDPAQLQAVRAGYTGGGTSLFFAGNTTIPVTPVIDNITGTVMHGESLIGLAPGVNGTNSLMWVEFEITAAPSVTSVFHFTNPTDSFILDPDLNTGNLTFVNGTYTYAAGPTIGANTRNPAGATVPAATPVTVSVNVTDPNNVTDVILNYTTDTAWTSVSMTLNATTQLYDGTIPGLAAGTTVKYIIIATNELGVTAIDDSGGLYYNYEVIPEFTIMIMLALVGLATVSLIVSKKKRFIR